MAAEGFPVGGEPCEDNDEDFVVDPRSSNMKKSLNKIDSFRGRPASDAASTWVAQHFPAGQRTATFSIPSYGARFASKLAAVWCNMLRTWYDEFVAAGGDTSRVYSPLNPRDHSDDAFVREVDELPENHGNKSRFELFVYLLPHYKP